MRELPSLTYLMKYLQSSPCAIPESVVWLLFVAMGERGRGEKGVTIDKLAGNDNLCEINCNLLELCFMTFKFNLTTPSGGGCCPCSPFQYKFIKLYRLPECRSH